MIVGFDKKSKMEAWWRFQIEEKVQMVGLGADERRCRNEADQRVFWSDLLLPWFDRIFRKEETIPD